MMRLAARIEAIQQQIQQAEHIYHRPLGSVKLLAVSKQHSARAITEAFDAGCRDFGENYVQEALSKINVLSNFPIHWHFIGAIQRNKTKALACHFEWVHTVDSRLIAERLNEARPQGLSPLNICIQLNLEREEQKSGVGIEEAVDLASHILTLPHLTLRGLMVIPKMTNDRTRQYETFSKVSQCLQEINCRLNIKMDTLSMGMSHDFETAIHAGSTMIRIGTAIFGSRQTRSE